MTAMAKSVLILMSATNEISAVFMKSAKTLRDHTNAPVRLDSSHVMVFVSMSMNATLIMNALIMPHATIPSVVINVAVIVDSLEMDSRVMTLMNAMTPFVMKVLNV